MKAAAEVAGAAKAVADVMRWVATAPTAAVIARIAAVIVRRASLALHVPRAARRLLRRNRPRHSTMPNVELMPVRGSR